jgi:hypothetical protein
MLCKYPGPAIACSAFGLQMEDNVLLFGHEDEFPEVF